MFSVVEGLLISPKAIMIKLLLIIIKLSN
jgi:hypothetical protein